LLLYRSRDTRFFSCGFTCHWNLACMGPLLFLCIASEPRREGNTWGGDVWGDQLSRYSFGRSLWFPLLQLFFRLSAVQVIGGVGFLSLRQLAVTTCLCGSSVLPLWALPVRVVAPATQTPGRLFAVCWVRKSILSSICLYPDCNMLAVGKSLAILPFWARWLGIGGVFLDVVPWDDDQHIVDIWHWWRQSRGSSVRQRCLRQGNW
jgi:hypothetical protein